MNFEFEDLRVVAPLDPKEGDCYIETLREDLDEFNLDRFYNVIVQREYYINPTAYGKLTWTILVHSL